jgi:stress response protein SCP2
VDNATPLGTVRGVDLRNGANAGLDSASVDVVVTGDVDVTALVVSADGRVSRDADMVFFNQPETDGVSLRGRTLHLELARLRPGATKVVVVASPELEGRSFAEAGDLRVLVRAGSEHELVLDPMGPETVAVLAEVYQRGSAWKVRAVGQGYDNGLAGLAKDFGVDVEDPSAPPPVLNVPDAPRTPEINVPEPTVPVLSVPSPGLVAPPGMTPSNASGTAAQAFGAPGAPPPSQSQVYFSGPPSAPTQVSTPALDLSKGRVELSKGQSVSLSKAGMALTGAVSMGLGWDAAGSGRSVDLDASVIAFNSAGRDLKKVWFLRTSAYRGALKHSGDNLTGAGEGDDEVIRVDLEKLPDEVTALVFTVNSYSGQDFTQVSRAFCRLLGPDGAELVRFDLTGSERSKGVLMAVMTRSVHGWSMTALGEFHDGRTVKAMVAPARDAVLRG